ncbi:lipopolysaccharide assembly protein LapB [Kingella kingae]|uniref:lipopolysaccharide assembly protein LapB n=1 Tax=Kingella kingae TaxID=504 RepID=UPI00254B37A9|nr:lipopolysaccharide assembly protein LapB [Kingella kingae]MDK4528715.1 lipopolysaccharide assembly protein LapB [Kingella kingae]MDK4543258.1 lipopolysaccharide assembly protein LapB [Kingella kingae]MDK4562690.1 lipopolysaccharide assembly protein LapB [Kingella kingae]MDK4602982.1 lipopolysaccharide assembly protein LapB [Kingella kingae]MDK4632967.1 lipopolysaccharide assembly protein LapB [Kingella kingae]
MDNNIDIWWLLIPICMLPVFFLLGWLAARVDMKTVVKHAKTVPENFYSAVDALVNDNKTAAARYLSEVAQMQNNAHELNLSLGKLYRQHGKNDKAIALHKALLDSPDTVNEKRERVLYELGLDYKSAGLVDRAEQTFLGLQSSNMAKQANEWLLNIYQQDRDWEKAIATAQLLAHDEQTYQFEIAQFYCEIGQNQFFHGNLNAAQEAVQAALLANPKCTRANILLGDIHQKEGNYRSAIDAYTAIEKQNYAYLTMVGEKLYDAYEALGEAQAGLDVLIGYAKAFPQIDFLNVIYDKSLLLHGETVANETALDLIRSKPDLNGMYRLIGLSMPDLNSQWKADADMMRGVLNRQLQKTWMYRCQHCHFKSQVYFWHCPACNKWETFTPNKIEV